MQKPFVISRIARDDNKDGELLNVYLDAVTVGPSRMPRGPGAFSIHNEVCCYCHK